jgi:magnesium chelatase family protein
MANGSHFENLILIRLTIHIVGLPDKAVAESRERVQAALHASGLAMPPKKITVNLAPADLPKEGVPKPH